MTKLATAHRATSPYRPEQIAPPTSRPELRHLRFARLLGGAAWSRLRPHVRRRFSGHANGAVYTGTITRLDANAAGVALTLLARLFGAPLPYRVGLGDAATVIVRDQHDGRNQTWTRVYHRADGSVQTVHSLKHFRADGGLEEQLSAGLVMRLAVAERGGDLAFISNQYLLRCGPLQLRLPAFLTPGTLTILHNDIDARCFDFELRLDHPWFGRMLWQTIRFQDQHQDDHHD